jgi:DNA-binding CsgD family transcriptional regulator
MKKSNVLNYFKWIGLSFFFLIVIQWSTDIQLIQWKDLRYALILIVGTMILMALSYKKGQTRYILRSSFRFNLFLTGLLMSLLNFLSLFSKIDMNIEFLEITECLKPLIYGIIIYLPVINILNEKDYQVIEISEGEQAIKKSIESLDLSRREREVVQLLFLDLSNKEIGEKLFIQESTVKKHLQNVYKKAQCVDRIELMKKFSILLPQ